MVLNLHLHLLACLGATLLRPMVAAATSQATNLTCSPAAISKPDLYGATILDLQAQEVYNYSSSSLGPGNNIVDIYTINFCNVTVTYTHPGWNDTINTQVWLPLEGWNGNFQALGGGGFAVGFGSTYLTYAVAQGYASVSSDGGLPSGTGAIPTDLSWALSSDNNINWFLLENYGSKAIIDMGLIGKQITHSYYHQAAAYSYFSGCSGGGRQGLLMAQQFPDVFDGILAVAPAVNFEIFGPTSYWANEVMHLNKTYPSPCEVEAFTAAVVEKCDGLDGVEDGIISMPAMCNITAFDLVGEPYTCNGTQYLLSDASAEVIDAAWSGPPGEYGWYGVNKDAALPGYAIPTTCSANGTCTATSDTLYGIFIAYLVAKNPDFDLSSMSESEYFDILHTSRTQYASILGSADPDLSKFKASGGKLISWQGLADEVIPAQGNIAYYESVLEKDQDAQDFYRFFEAPGVGHCYGGLGPVPNGAFAQLVEWVENGQAPDTLHADHGSNSTSRDLCPYPLQQTYVSGDSRNASSFTCV